MIEISAEDLAALVRRNDRVELFMSLPRVEGQYHQAVRVDVLYGSADPVFRFQLQIDNRTVRDVQLPLSVIWDFFPFLLRGLQRLESEGGP